MFAIAIAAAFVLYAPLLPLSFFSDDLIVIWRTHRGEPGLVGFFRPLSDASIAWCHTFSGTDPLGHRAFNVLVHGVCTALVVRLTFRLTATRPAAVFAGLLFLCYPFHNEAVAWIVGRGSSMTTGCTLLFLLALLSDKGLWSTGSITASCLFVGLLAYESAFLMPLLAVPVFLWWRPFDRGALALFGTWAGVIAVHLALRWHFTGTVVNTYGTGVWELAATNWPTNVPKVLARLVLPPLSDPRLATALFVVVVLLIAGAAWYFRRRVTVDAEKRQVLLLLNAWLLIACALGVVAGVSTRTSESDRFLYMPSAFLCPLVATVVALLPARSTRIAITGVLLALAGTGLYHNDRNWIAASATVQDVLTNVPAAPVGHRLFVSGVPGDIAGAFVLRNGFAEGLLLAGKDTARTQLAESIEWNGRPFAVTRQGDTLLVQPGDQWFHYGGMR